MGLKSVRVGFWFRLRGNLFTSAFSIFLCVNAFASDVINGAGSSFIYPLMSKWAYFYRQELGIKLNYQSIGSGGGIRQIRNRTVDFGASDAPLSPEEVKKFNLAQFPVVIGGVVVSYNLPLKNLRLSTKVICDIFLGKIKGWDSPEIKKLNPEMKLPSRKITVVRRADGSGTTWIFTNYLSKACPEWKEKVGYGKAVNWPTGIGAKGNEGVANYIKRIKGAIGYVEFAHALNNKLNYAYIENRDGKFVRPSQETFQSAAANAKWDMNLDFYEVLTWQKGENSYPIVGATFVLMAKDYKKERNRRIIKFFNWVFEKGDKIARELNYVPIPESVKQKIREYWKKLGWF